jgi:hypothetical protein
MREIAMAKSSEALKAYLERVPEVLVAYRSGDCRREDYAAGVRRHREALKRTERTLAALRATVESPKRST